MLRLRQFTAMAGLAAVHAWRQPIVLLLTVAAVVLTALCPVLSLFHFDEEGKLARDAGLAFQWLFGLLVAVHGACTTLSDEMNQGTASLVLGKPVGRAPFFLAKFAGLLAVLLSFSLCTALATLLSERVSEKFCSNREVFGYITDWQTGNMLLAAPCLALAAAAAMNYRTRRPFASTAFGLLVIALAAVLLLAGAFDREGLPARYDLQVQWRILPAVGLVFLSLGVMAALTLSLSTRLSLVPTLALSLLILAAGFLSDRLGADSSVVRALLPNWQHFWMADALDDGGRIAFGYAWRAAAYAAACAGGVLCLGLVSFRHADMR
jgi:hypothetical protein